jgi:mannose-6-phosphate isomerase
MAALPVRMVEKPWGKASLPAPFTAPVGQRIGEVWFEPPPGFDHILVKYIFTSERLSVQLHPSDPQTQAAGLGRQGKDECWLVIDADPGAALAVGFAGEVDTPTMRAAALDGSIEDLLVWRPVSRGDFIYLPANTVHAIGAGVSLIEVQQNSDITYRLYDYGRPRELHLAEGLAVARGGPHDPALRRHLPERGHVALVDGPYFRLDRLDGPAKAADTARYAGPLLAIPLDGEVEVAGGVVAAGDCALAQSIEEVDIPEGVQCLVTQPVEKSP